MLGLLVSVALVGVGVLLWLREASQVPERVARDLLGDFTNSSPVSRAHTGKRRGGYDSSKALVLIVLGGLFVALMMWGASHVGVSWSSVVAGSFGSLGFGFLVWKRIEATRKESHLRSVEYFVPIVMERIVMAVESGHDVLSALRVIVHLAREEAGRGSVDPMTALLQRVIRLSDEGMKFDEALELVSKESPVAAVKHAFVHLAVACREGGELVHPLRELSDSSQSMYQESVEEDIAKMPVKATLPLVVTFAGLLLLFIATPLVQVVSFVDRSSLSQDKGQ